MKAVDNQVVYLEDMMRDAEGQYLHKDELVTFLAAARPRWLAGRHGVVKVFGEIRIQIELEPILKSEEGKLVRVDPAMLVRGRRHITAPEMADPELLSQISHFLVQYVDSYLDEALSLNIISAKQKSGLQKLLRLREQALSSKKK